MNNESAHYSFLIIHYSLNFVGVVGFEPTQT